MKEQIGSWIMAIKPGVVIVNIRGSKSMARHVLCYSYRDSSDAATQNLVISWRVRQVGVGWQTGLLIFLGATFINKQIFVCVPSTLAAVHLLHPAGWGVKK